MLKIYATWSKKVEAKLKLMSSKLRIGSFFSKYLSVSKFFLKNEKLFCWLCFFAFFSSNLLF